MFNYITLKHLVTRRSLLLRRVNVSLHRWFYFKSQLLRSKLLCDWPVGFCRLLLPNGQYHFVNIERPDVQYERSVLESFSTQNVMYNIGSTDSKRLLWMSRKDFTLLICAYILHTYLDTYKTNIIVHLSNFCSLKKGC